MTDVGQIELKAQKRVVGLFSDRLGYTYLGNWQDNPTNPNVDAERLRANLERRGYDDTLITKALEQLDKACRLGGGRDLYEANRDVYVLLRYGVRVRAEAGEQKQTVWLIDWDDVEANDFGIAEEVTVSGQNTKRPDLVLYVNGIAVAVIELKRSKVAVSEGIRQTIGNQKSEFIRPFFTTVQLVLAGNDVEGLRYAVIDTPEKHWLSWRLPADIEAGLRDQIAAGLVGVDGILDQALAQLCSKERLLEVVHDFIVFDAGTKKTCRPNQYFGVKAARVRAQERAGGIIWHTQGSGKSLTMVWLAKWLRERHSARVLIITDRTELDEQIEGVFGGVDETVYRTSTGQDLLDTLNRSDEWLMCTLIHKFRGSPEEGGETEEPDDFLDKLRASLPADFEPKGKIFVFVDEAHRTQSGKMHRAMKALLPDAVFIGFTGTPLLKGDKSTSLKTFGTFIHTYKFDEAVRDGVVLDLRYEARDIDQSLPSRERIDQWFDIKTQGLTDAARASLKRRWATTQALHSSASRTQQIVQDILVDMATKPRLADGRGNALLVCSNIYQAATFYEQFRNVGFKRKCAVVTSYAPRAADIAKEDSGEGATEKQRLHDIYKQMLSDFDMDDVEAFEKEVKRRFVDEPGQMRLLIVVDKLLTGFDAPSATYLYIDKQMRDHGLFQAICRVNRLDGDDKDYGHVVDYRDLFKSLDRAVKDYTTEALDGYDEQDVDGLLKDRVTEAKADLEDALAAVDALCETIEEPRTTLKYQQRFCAVSPGDAAELAANEPRRIELCKSVAALVRAYANIANELDAAGYSEAQAKAVRDKVAHYSDVRDEVRLGAGEAVDYKRYEAGMRFLLDTYVQASPSTKVGDFAEAGLVQLIVEMGEGAIGTLPPGIKDDPEAVSSTIVNNVRTLITDERPTNPRYYDKMSEVLDALIEQRRSGALEYQQYLQQLVAQVKQIAGGGSDEAYPAWADTGARRALIDFELPGGEATARAVEAAMSSSRRADWVGSRMKERRVLRSIERVLPDDYDRVDELMALLRERAEYR